MGSVEERLASLEARVDPMTDLRPLITELREEMSRGFSELRGEMSRGFSELRGEMNQRFAQVDANLLELRGEMNQRFADMNQRFEHVNRRIDTLDEKSDRHFTWLVGIQVASMLAVVGALVGAYYR